MDVQAMQTPEDAEVKNIIDKLANFVARNGSDFENMTKEKQRDNPKFSFLFGGPYFQYYQFKLSTERQLYLNQQNDQSAMQDNSNMYPKPAVWQQQSQQQLGENYSYSGPPPTMPSMPMGNVPPWQQPNMSMPPMPMYQSQQINPDGNQSQMNFSSGGQPQYSSHQQGSNFQQQMLNQPLRKDNSSPHLTDIELKKKEIEVAEEVAKKEISQSQSNLDQQYEVLMSKQQELIETQIEKSEEDNLNHAAKMVNVNLSELNDKLAPIIKSCTKDSISNGKAFILSNAKSSQHSDVLVKFILKRVMEINKENGDEKTSEKFEKQLHVIYLINDVLHHSSRKNLTDIQQSIGKYIIPIFCTASIGVSDADAKKERLNKLLGLWAKFKYFDEETTEKLQDPTNALAIYQACLITEHADIVKQAQNNTEEQFSQFREQHEQYASHVMQQLEIKKEDLEKLIKEEERKKNEEQSRRQKSSEPPWARLQGIEANSPQVQQFDYGHGQGRNHAGPGPNRDYGPPPEWGNNHPPPPMHEWGPRGGPPPWHNAGPRPPNPDWRGHHPPRPMQPNDHSLIPKAPYYELPVGLMCPLVRLSQTEYKPLDPSLIRLPPPVPPSDRLLAALDAFYAPPSHDRPRNLDGWEQMGLYEFFRAKVQAKRHGDDYNNKPYEERSRQRSYSRSRSRSYSRSYSKSRSRSRSSSRSRSRSYSRSRSRSYSRSRSRSYSPGNKRRDRPQSPTDRNVAPTLPQVGANLNQSLGDDNRGAQMMKRMGWGGAGLGSGEQGRQEPISGGEVREKYDQFKGLGMPGNDPYENFRKSKSQGFIARIKSRAEDGGSSKASDKH